MQPYFKTTSSDVCFGRRARLPVPKTVLRPALSLLRAKSQKRILDHVAVKMARLPLGPDECNGPRTKSRFSCPTVKPAYRALHGTDLVKRNFKSFVNLGWRRSDFLPLEKQTSISVASVSEVLSTPRYTGFSDA